MKIELIGIKTGFITPADNIFQTFCSSLESNKINLQPEDIVVISSKVIALEQGRTIQLDSVPIHPRSLDFEKDTNLDPRFISLIMQESDVIFGGVPGALLTMRDGVLQANAGIDQSNTPKDTAILLPNDSNKYADNFASKIMAEYGLSVNVLIIDSATRPLRRGTTGLCVGYSKAFPAVLDDRGSKDLLGNEMIITTRAIADNIATSANIVMGESDQSTPFALVRGLPIDVWKKKFNSIIDMKIEFDKCLYFKNFNKNPLYTKKGE
ncbi:MAG: coenzyme F420-0:L-glutamate ligase [Candidatus Hodarchaeales archaeon]|jgi:coenzyme F420-0:L-glutamate ligase